MRDALLDLIAEGNGVLHRRAALERVPVGALDHALTTGLLVRVLPSTYALRDWADDPETLRRAALAYAGEGAALSHLSALREWELPVPEGHPDHVTVPAARRPRATGLIHFHRSRGLAAPQRQVVVRHGMPVVRLERAVVESWPLLDRDAQRAPAIMAVQRRLTTVQRLQTALGAAPKLRARAELHQLLELLAAGCHSELEIWGHLDVFSHPELPASRAQVPVRIGSRTIYCDRLYEEEMVDVELDGRKYHSDSAQRERDIRRDVALSMRGFLVVRFGHDPIAWTPGQVRAELLQILAMRRRQLGVA